MEKFSIKTLPLRFRTQVYLRTRKEELKKNIEIGKNQGKENEREIMIDMRIEEGKILTTLLIATKIKKEIGTIKIEMKETTI